MIHNSDINIIETAIYKINILYSYANIINEFTHRDCNLGNCKCVHGCTWKN